MAATQRLAGSVAVEGGCVDAVELHAGGLHVIGWESQPGLLAKRVEVKIGGSPVAPGSVVSARRPDVAAAVDPSLLLAGVRLEYPILPSATPIALTVQVEGKPLVEHSFAPAEPHYSPLLFARDVYHRDGIYSTGPAQVHVDPEIWEFVQALPGPILDFGCGSGALVAKLREAGLDAEGIEVDSPGGRAAVVPASRPFVRFYDGSLPVPVESGAYASVTCTEVLEHIERFEEVAAELARISSRFVFVTVPDITAVPMLYAQGVVPWHLLEATHINFFGPASLEALLAPHFKRVRVFRLGKSAVHGTEYFCNVAALCEK